MRCSGWPKTTWIKGRSRRSGSNAIQEMINILARLVEQQSQAPVNQSRDPEIWEDMALERFKKFLRAVPTISHHWSLFYYMSKTCQVTYITKPHADRPSSWNVMTLVTCYNQHDWTLCFMEMLIKCCSTNYCWKVTNNFCFQNI